MQKFKSHKIVEAVKIADITPNHENTGAFIVPMQTGETRLDNIAVSRAYLIKHEPEPFGYYIRYTDGYESFSPAQAFEEGYTAVDDAYPTREETLTTGQPKITTYRNLNQVEVDMMNLIKASETSIAVLFGLVHDHLQAQLVGAMNVEGSSGPELDRRDRAQPERWVAMARTDFQIAFMKLTRAVAQPNSAL